MIKVRVAPSPHGLGLRATQAIAAGEEVAPYPVVFERESAISARHPERDYLVGVPGRSDLVALPDRRGRWADFCGIFANEGDKHDQNNVILCDASNILSRRRRRRRVGSRERYTLVATRSINKGEWILLNYGRRYDRSKWSR